MADGHLLVLHLISYMKLLLLKRKEFLFFIFVGCQLNNYTSNKIVSTSKKFYFITTVNKSDKSKKDYGDIVINLYNTKENSYP